MELQEIERLLGWNTESQNLEWKSSHSLKPVDGDKQGLHKIYEAKLARAIMALSNSGGGNIIIGIDEKRQNDTRLQGVSSDLLGQWNMDDLCDKMNSYMSPRPDFHIEMVDYPPTNSAEFPTRQYIIIIVPEFEKQPILCIKEVQNLRRGQDQNENREEDQDKFITAKGVCYVRSRDTKPASIPVVTYDDMRDLWERAGYKYSQRIREQCAKLDLSGMSEPPLNDEDLFKQQREG